VIPIFEQIFPGDSIVTIVVQLPKATVKDIKVLVREVPRDLVDVLLFIDKLEGCDEVRAAYLPRSDAPIMASINGIKDTSD